MGETRQAPGARRILWDVLEEHLDEAAFLWRQRTRVQVAPDVLLQDLAEGDEERLMAHLEGLVIGSTSAAKRLLQPALVSGTGELAGPAAWALLSSETEDWLPAVLEALFHGEPEARPGLHLALALSDRPGLNAALEHAAVGLAPTRLAELLDIRYRRRGSTQALLSRLPQEAKPFVLGAALRVMRLGSLAEATPWIRSGLRDPRPEVRDSALMTGLIHGLRDAWTMCRRLVEQRAPALRVPLLILALGGGLRETELLLEVLADPALRNEALWALGFSGRRVAAEALLGFVINDESGLAADSFATLTGLPLREANFQQPPGARMELPDEEDASATSGEDEVSLEMPGPPVLTWRPQPAQFEAWWHQTRDRFDPRGRYLLGRPWTPEALLTALEEVPLRRRYALCLELAVRSGGACQVEVQAWTWIQRQQISQGSRARLFPQSFDACITR